jgi:hypothetical protein
MTVTCSWCLKEMGEICPHCGRPAIPVVFEWRLLFANLRIVILLAALGMLRHKWTEARLYLCTPGSSCRQVLFLRGLGGASHGICNACGDQQRKDFSVLAARTSAKGAN